MRFTEGSKRATALTAEVNEKSDELAHVIINYLRTLQRLQMLFKTVDYRGILKVLELFEIRAYH